MPQPEMTDARRSLRLHALFGFVVLLVLVGGLGAWAGVTHISGAVIAPGQIVVETSAKKVQHPEGGVVAELKVHEGDLVKTGDLLVRLDDTLVKANLAIVVKQIDELVAQEARLIAERDGAKEIVFPADFLERVPTDPDVAAAMRGHKNIFETGVITRSNRREQLEEQIKQLESSVEGLTAQRNARDSEITLIGQELKGVEELFKKNMVPLPRVISLQRERTRLEGERGKLVSDIAASRGQISEKRVSILRLEDDFRSEVMKGLSETRAKLAELVERRGAARDRLARIEIRAPQTGRVHALVLHTVGGVLQASETAMLIVPQEDRLVVDAQVDPGDIDEVHLGQKAVIKFSAFSDRSLLDIEGDVVNVAPDLIEEQATRRRYYKVKIAVGQVVDTAGKALLLVPGMPVEAFIQKGDRTVLGYLVKPLRDQLGRVFRE